MRARPYPLLFILCFIILSLPAPEAAACSRDDINFYLNKGFTQSQITALCGDGRDAPSGYSGTDAREKEAYRRGLMRRDREEAAYRRGLMRRDRDDDNRFVRNALDAYDVRLTPQYLEYTNSLCLRVINNPDTEARGKICPDVQFRVYLRGLDIKGYDKRFIIAGNREIKVNGKIRRRLVGSLNDYPAHIRQVILRSFNDRKKSKTAAIPVLEDSSAKRVAAILSKRVEKADADAIKRKRRK